MIVFNEGERIKTQMKEAAPFANLIDLVIVDGESTDGSLIDSNLRSNRIRALVTTPEPGLCTATRLGLAFAMAQGYAGALTVDGNGKDGMEAIPAFLDKLEEGFDLIQGSRFLPGATHRNTPWDRYVAVRYIAAPLFSLGCRFRYTDPTNAFRAMSRRYLLDRRLQPFRGEFVRFNLQHYLIYRAPRLGLKCCEIPVRRVYPDSGEVPTKLKFCSKCLVLWELLLTIAGTYNPSPADEPET